LNEVIIKDIENRNPMGDKDTQKFMFDLHSFDVPDELEEENLPPPPPTFSEEELAAAQKKSFDEGFAQAMEESKNSREEYIAQQLQRVSANFSELYTAEIERAERFEQEVLSLSAVMLKQCFPMMVERHGQDEIAAIIKRAFAQNEDASEIVVYVCVSDKVEIEAAMGLMSPRPENLTCEADELLEAGSVRMKWKDGGAMRDTGDMGKKIADILSKTLASEGVNDHNQELNDGDDES
jgi:flagellar assembly protein FliH